MNSPRVLLGIAMSILFFLALQVAMQVLNNVLTTYSIRQIKAFSKNWKVTTFAVFMENYSDYGLIALCSLWLVYVLVSGPKISQILWVNGVALSLTLTAFLSCIYHQLRPSWLDASIPILDRNTSYGDPSLLSALAGSVVFGGLAVYLFNNSDFCLSQLEKDMFLKARVGLLYKLPSKIIVTGIVLVGHGLLIFSEVYTGTSTVGQALNGLLTSVLCVLTFFFTLRSSLAEHYKGLLAGQTSARTPLIVLVTVALSLVLAQCITFCVFKAFDIKVDSASLKHVQRFIPNFTEDTPLTSSLMNSGLGFIAVGSHLGFTLQPRLFNIDPSRVTNYTSPVGKVFRLVFAAFMILPLPLVMLLYVPSSPVLVLVWLKAIFPCTFLGFMFFALGDFLMARLGLLPKKSESRNIEGKQSMSLELGLIKKTYEENSKSELVVVQENEMPNGARDKRTPLLM